MKLDTETLSKELAEKCNTSYLKLNRNKVIFPNIFVSYQRQIRQGGRRQQSC
jgi:hypothetical protein